jgi:hypothetical protein
MTTLDEDLRVAREKLDVDGGVITVTALFNLDGTIASGPLRRNKFGGREWRLSDTATAVYGTRYVRPSHAIKSATRRRFMKAKGFKIGMISVPGIVKVDDHAHRVITVPDEDAFYAGRYEVIDVDVDD